MPHPLNSSTQSRADVQKFQFDDFDIAEQINADFEETTPVEQSFTSTDVDAVRSEAANKGYERGVEDTQAAIDAETARLLAQISGNVAAILAEQQSQRAFIAAEAVRLSAVIARRVLPALAEAGALTEIEALIARCLNDRPEESRMVVRLHDTMLDPISARMDKMVHESGFGAKPVLLVDPNMRRSEIRIEWANGGVDWNFDGQLADIEATSRRLAARPTKIKTKTEPAEDADDLNMESEL